MNKREKQQAKSKDLTLLREYKLNLKHYIMTSRFSNNTWEENKKYRLNHKNIGCIYCSPEPIASHIPLDKFHFILEMNNDLNKIMGIGTVRNHPIFL